MIKHIKLEGACRVEFIFLCGTDFFLCLNLKQWDQFAVTALRAFSVKIVGVAKSTIRVKKIEIVRCSNQS